jgi:hypothetical protein
LPTDTERRLEQLENLLLFGGGIVAGSASGRQLAAKGGRAVAMSPIGRATILGNLANQAAILAEEAFIQEQGIDPGLAFTPGLPPLMREQMLLQSPEIRGAVVKGAKRKVSKANKAVKHAMGLLKAGTKASTGADKGKLVKGAFKMATKAAGLANPNTASKIKGKGKLKALARKIKRWW